MGAQHNDRQDSVQTEGEQGIEGFTAKTTYTVHEDVRY